MKNLFYKIAGVLLVIFVFRFLQVSGNLDLTYLMRAKEAVQAVMASEEGQAVIEDIKEAALLTLDDVDEFIRDKKIVINTDNLSDVCECELIRVVDGDTIIVNYEGTEQYVRLIGIDTPESVHPDEEKNNEYGKAASEYAKELFSDQKKVYLQFDKDPYDDYGRLLAYVWNTKYYNAKNPADIYAKMYNAVLIKNGYAKVKTIAPNETFSLYFQILEKYAQATGAGLWCSSGYRDK